MASRCHKTQSVELVLMPTREDMLRSVQALYGNLATLPKQLRVEFELRVAEGPFCRSFHLSDAEFVSIQRLPAKVTVISAHMGLVAPLHPRSAQPLRCSLLRLLHCKRLQLEVKCALGRVVSRTSGGNTARCIHSRP